MEKENILPAASTGRRPASRPTRESRALPPPGRCSSRREQEDPAGRENGRPLRPAATRPGASPEAVEELPDPPPTARPAPRQVAQQPISPSAPRRLRRELGHALRLPPARERKAARLVGVVCGRGLRLSLMYRHVYSDRQIHNQHR